MSGHSGSLDRERELALPVTARLMATCLSISISWKQSNTSLGKKKEEEENYLEGQSFLIDTFSPVHPERTDICRQINAGQRETQHAVLEGGDQDS